ncbi:MAG: hypothetical protein K2O33_02075, partial [Muribaculaceae bacterium]|nr:hypothetical protein [Muribaculaceae bacterium]
MEQYPERQSEAIEPMDAVEHAGPGTRATERGSFVIPQPGEKVYFASGVATPLATLFAEHADRIENVNTRRDAAKFVSAFGLFDAGRGLLPDALNADMVNIHTKADEIVGSVSEIGV